MFVCDLVSETALKSRAVQHPDVWLWDRNDSSVFGFTFWAPVINTFIEWERSICTLKHTTWLQLESPSWCIMGRSQSLSYAGGVRELREVSDRPSVHHILTAHWNTSTALITIRVCERSGAATISPPRSEHIIITTLRVHHFPLPLGLSP